MKIEIIPGPRVRLDGIVRGSLAQVLREAPADLAAGIEAAVEARYAEQQQLWQAKLTAEQTRLGDERDTFRAKHEASAAENERLRVRLGA